MEMRFCEVQIWGHDSSFWRKLIEMKTQMTTSICTTPPPLSQNEECLTWKKNTFKSAISFRIYFDISWWVFQSCSMTKPNFCLGNKTWHPIVTLTRFNESISNVFLSQDQLQKLSTADRTQDTGQMSRLKQSDWVKIWWVPNQIN